jgi:hypothetical protein
LADVVVEYRPKPKLHIGASIDLTRCLVIARIELETCYMPNVLSEKDRPNTVSGAYFEYRI